MTRIARIGRSGSESAGRVRVRVIATDLLTSATFAIHLRFPNSLTQRSVCSRPPIGRQLVLKGHIFHVVVPLSRSKRVPVYHVHLLREDLPVSQLSTSASSAMEAEAAKFTVGGPRGLSDKDLVPK